MDLCKKNTANIMLIRSVADNDTVFTNLALNGDWGKFLAKSRRLYLIHRCLWEPEMILLDMLNWINVNIITKQCLWRPAGLFLMKNKDGLKYLPYIMSCLPEITRIRSFN